MKIVIIGSGGREHAIIKKMKESRLCGGVTALPGNGGIAADANCVDIKADDIDGVVGYCVSNSVDYVVVTPDDPLALGLVDALTEVGIAAFGPTKAAARIESSKVFAKELMRKYGIPTASYAAFDEAQDAEQYVRKQTKYPLVVKADGLALGKGVRICQNAEEALDAVSAMMRGKQFGESGARIVVEEYLTGPEVSVLAFCDGETIAPMVSSMDHKRAFDGDLGPNTGGMGAVAPNPYYTEATAKRCMESIFLPTVRAMKEECAPFKGCLYFGLMLTLDGPKVIEYNCRFGDPETQVVLPLLNSDLLDVMLACTNGSLRADMVRIRAGSAACVVVASGGYPEVYQTGYPITGVTQAGDLDGVAVFHAGTRRLNGSVVTSGGRVLGVTATGDQLSTAIEKAYQAAAKVRFTDSYYRRDIGKSALAAQQ